MSQEKSKALEVKQPIGLVHLPKGDQELYKSLSKPTIKQIIDQGIEALPPEAIDPLKGYKLAEFLIGAGLVIVFRMVGLTKKNEPDKILKGLLLKTVIRKYSYITPEEIPTAFEMAIDEKIGIKLEDLEHFQAFDLLYLNKVLGAYCKWRHPIKINLDERVTELSRDRRQEILDNRPKNSKAVKDMLILILEENERSGKVDFSKLRSEYYEYLNDLGLVRPITLHEYVNAHRALKQATADQVIKRVKFNLIKASMDKMLVQDYDLLKKLGKLDFISMYDHQELIKHKKNDLQT